MPRFSVNTVKHDPTGNPHQGIDYVFLSATWTGGRNDGRFSNTFITLYHSDASVDRRVIPHREVPLLISRIFSEVFPVL